MDNAAEVAIFDHGFRLRDAKAKSDRRVAINMPLMRIDMLKGRKADEIKQILDISYTVMLAAFNALEGDRYQVVSQHEPYEM